MNILEVEELEKKMHKKRIINQLSFQVEEGKIVGFIGPNGAGKTTTLKLITNILIPDSGVVRIGGHNVVKSREKALEHVSGIIENPALYEELTGYENLQFIRKLRKRSKEEMDQMIELTGIGSAIHKKTARYSLGMKQRLAIGMAFLAKPKLLILDEPTNGLDATGVMELRKHIQQMAKEGTAVLLSSHMLGEVEKVADDIIFIKNGTIVERHSMDKQESQENLETMYLNIYAGERAKL